MKSKSLIKITIISLVIFSISSCNSAKNDWEKIKNSNNRIDYVIYLNNHNKKEFRIAAQKRLNYIDDSLEFENIKNDFSIKSCNNYIKSHSTSIRAKNRGFFINESKKLIKEIKASWESELSDSDTIFFDVTFENIRPSYNRIKSNIFNEVSNKLDTLDIILTTIPNLENDSDLKIEVIFDGIALDKIYDIYSTTKTSGPYGRTTHNNYTKKQYSGAITKGQVIITKKGLTLFSQDFYKKISPPINFEQKTYDSPESAPFHITEFEAFSIEKINSFIDDNTKRTTN